MSQELGTCVSCGKAFTNESEIIFGDDGHLCYACEQDEDAQRSWDKGMSAQVIAPIGLSLLSLVFNPLWLVTFAAISAGVWNIKAVLGSNQDAGDFTLSASQRSGLAITGVIGILFAVIPQLIRFLPIFLE